MSKGMTNRELINALIEHYAECGEVELELFCTNKADSLMPTKFFVITHPTEAHSLALKEVPEFKEEKRT